MAKARQSRNREVERLRARLQEAEETLGAIRCGEVDAIAVDGPRGRQVFTLQSADQPYRILVEWMSEGAASTTPDGTILFCNRRLAEMTGLPPEKLVGTQAALLVAPPDRNVFQQLLNKALQGQSRGQVQFQRGDGSSFPVLASLKGIAIEPAGGICLIATDLSEHKQMEERLRHLAAIVENSDDAIYSKDLAGRITSWNRAAERIFGYTAAEITGQPLTRLAPDGGEQIEDILSRIRNGETVEHYETTRTRKNGTRCEVSITVSPIRDAQGRISGASSIALDITKRKQMERELQYQQFYTRSLIEASLDPLVTISREGKITDVNRATEVVTGVAREALIGSDFSDYFSDPDKARAGYQQVFADGIVQDYPLAIRHVSGRLTEVLYNATVYRNQEGAVEGVFAAARDVTERHQAEQRLARQQFYTRSLIEASLDPLMTTDPQGVITDVNSQMESLTGCSRQQLIGSLFKQYCTEPERAEEGIQRVLRAGTVTDYELAVRSRAGAATLVAYNATTYRDPDGRLAGVFAAARDITERKRAERALEQYAAELKRSNADLQDFAYIASHDLQEPLRKIAAFGDRLRDHCGPLLDATAGDYLARMLHASDRMAALIDGLLQYSRLSTRAAPLATVDLMQVALEVVVDLEERRRACGARIVCAVLPSLRADRTQMRQLLQNLIGNAIKFRRPEVPPLVRVSARRLPASPPATTSDQPPATSDQPPAWELAVADNGIGFDQSYADRLFRPFQRLHGRSQYEGSGMGLAICRKIAERHGGTISVRSRPGEGSVFTVRLPAAGSG